MRFPRRLIDLVGAFAARMEEAAAHPSSGDDAASLATMTADL
jgi:hypothetical protein